MAVKQSGRGDRLCAEALGERKVAGNTLLAMRLRESRDEIHTLRIRTGVQPGQNEKYADIIGSELFDGKKYFRQ